MTAHVRVFAFIAGIIAVSLLCHTRAQSESPSDRCDKSCPACPACAVCGGGKDAKPCCAAKAANYAAEWERAGLGSYPVGPTDILKIEPVGCDSSKLADAVGQRLVDADGTICLGAFGKLDVAGKTLEEVQQAVEVKLEGIAEKDQVKVDLFAANSKCVYVIAETGGLGDNVFQSPFMPKTTVGDVLAQPSSEEQATFAEAEISVRRSSPCGGTGEKILRVNWDAEANAPTAATNYRLMPGDRIFVKSAAAVAEAAPPTPVVFYQAAPAPQPPRPAPLAKEDIAPISGQSATQVIVSVLVFQDSSNGLLDLSELQQKQYTMAKTTLLCFLRKLEYVNLVHQLANPRMIVTVGHEGTLEVVGPSPNEGEPWQGIRFKASVKELRDGLDIDFEFAKNHGMQKMQVKTRTIVPEGRSIVMQVGKWPGATDDNQASNERDAEPVYLVLTPEVVHPQPERAARIPPTPAIEK